MVVWKTLKLVDLALVPVEFSKIFTGTYPNQFEVGSFSPTSNPFIIGCSAPSGTIQSILKKLRKSTVATVGCRKDSIHGLKLNYCKCSKEVNDQQ